MITKPGVCPSNSAFPTLPNFSSTATCPSHARHSGWREIFRGGFASIFALSLLLFIAAVPAQAERKVETLPAGSAPHAVVVNPKTNKTYVVNSSGSVTIVDGATDSTTTVAVGTLPKDAAVNPATNKIYVTNNGSNNVTVIDGATNATTTVATGGGAYGVAVNPVTNKIYVANYTDGTVSVIDGTTNSTATVAAGAGAYAVAVNPVTNKIYVTNSSAATVTVIDGATNSPTTVNVGSNPLAVAANPVTNKIYVANLGSNNVTVIDGATNSTTPITLSAAPRAVAVNPVTNRIYVVTSHTLAVIDGASNVAAEQPATGPDLVADPEAVALNPITNRVYVSNTTGSVTVFEADSNLGGLNIDPGLGPIAVNPVTNRVFVANVDHDNVTVIDGSSYDYAPVVVGSEPQHVAVNPVTNKIYVTNYSGNSVTVIDGTDNFTATIPSAGNPSAVAINPVTNRIYVANINGASVTVIDGTNDTVLDEVLTGDFPGAIAVNPVTNRIYVATESGTVTVIDGDTDFSTQVAAGANMRAVGANAVTNKIYVVNYGSAFVTVIDGASNTAINIPSQTGGYAVGVNSVTNRIYVANYTHNNALVIDGATNFATTVNTGASPQSVAVNPISNKIYIGNIDSNDVTVIDGATNSTTTVPLGPVSPYSVAVNPVTNKIYVSVIDCCVLEIDGASTTPPDGLSIGSDSSSVTVNPITNVVYSVRVNADAVNAIVEQNVQPSPLVTTIDPLPDNQTDNPTPAFDFSATSSYFPIAAPVDSLLFQFDTWQGKWQAAQPTGFGFFSGTPTAPLAAGPHILYAYATDGSQATSIMGGFSSSPIIGAINAYYFIVKPPTIPTTTTLTSNVNPVLAGHSVTFTAFVQTTPPSSKIPKGSVGFFDGSTLLQTVALVGTGSATYQTSSLSGGSHSITATYIPAAGFASSDSNVVNEVVGQPLGFSSAGTTTFTVGVSGSFTVTTTGSPTPSIGRSGTLPSGVTFVDNGNGTGTLSGTPASGTQNTYSLTFTAHNGVTSDATQSFSLVVNPPVLQSIAVSPSPASVGVGQTVTFTATGLYSGGSTQNLTNTAIWHSSDTSRATIASSGVATGISAGGSNITATSGSITSSPSLLTVTAAGLSFSPTSVAFGQVTTYTRTTQVLTVSNRGSAAVQFSKISLGSLNNVSSDDLQQSNNCGSSLAGGRSCQVTLSLRPSKTGSISAILSFQDNASGSPQQVQVTATGTAPKATVSPSSLSFSNQNVNTTSGSKTVTLTNSGTGPLTISGITLTGSNPTEFVITGNGCGSSLAQGAHCTVSVAFKPKSKSSRSATLRFTDNAQTTTQNVSLSGKGN